MERNSLPLKSQIRHWPIYMKRTTYLCLVLLTVIGLVGCRRSKPVPAPAAIPATSSAEAASAAGPVAPVDPKKLPDAPPMEVDHSAITTALRNYVADRQINPKLVTDLNVLVPKYLPSLPPPPQGKKYVWDRTLVVLLANK